MASNMSKSGKYMGCRVAKWLRLAIYIRDNFTCQHCGDDLHGAKPNDINLDHVIPQSQGGTNDPTNLITSCQWCNKRRQAKTIAQFHPGKEGKWARNRIAKAMARTINKAMAKSLVAAQKASK